MIVGYRDEAGFRKRPDHVGPPRQVQPSVHGREERHTKPAEQREMPPVDVRVDDVEILGPLRNRLQQDGTDGTRIGALSSKAKRARPDRVKLAARPRIAAREQRNVVSEFDQFVDQPGDHPLRPAVELRRHAFGQRSDLGDAHNGPA